MIPEAAHCFFILTYSTRPFKASVSLLPFHASLGFMYQGSLGPRANRQSSRPPPHTKVVPPKHGDPGTEAFIQDNRAKCPLVTGSGAGAVLEVQFWSRLERAAWLQRAPQVERGTAPACPFPKAPIVPHQPSTCTITRSLNLDRSWLFEFNPTQPDSSIHLN